MPRLCRGAARCAPGRNEQKCSAQSGFSCFTPHQTATQHKSPPTTCSPPANSSHSPSQLSANDEQTHPHSETDATSTSSTTKISALSKRAASTRPNIDPIHRSLRVYKNQRVPASKREHPPQLNSTLLPPSVERYAPHRLAGTTFHDASARQQNFASASRLFAESLRRATRIHRASQIAPATPSRFDHPTNPRCFRRVHTANTAAKFPETAY